MPKIKTNSGAKKRFRITKKGKVIKSNSRKNHLLEKKTTKRKRKLRKSSEVAKSERGRIKRMLPNAS
jgi:large subunit ribosomal protein L35